MQPTINRRRFLSTSAASAAGAALGAASAIQLPEKTVRGAGVVSLGSEQGDGERPLFEISLAQWSLHRKIRAGEMNPLDFAKVAKEEFGIDAIEYVNSFFSKKVKDKKYLSEMKQRAGDLGVKTLLIMVDREGKIGDPDKARRTRSVENHYKWVEVAKDFGCHSIRVNAASAGGYQEQVGYASDGLAKLSQFAADFDINVIVENHGGLSSNGQWLAQVIRNVGMANCGTLPDFGNFTINRGQTGAEPIVYDRYIGMASLMPFAKAVSAKSYDFDDQGNETTIDFEKMLTIMLDAGYAGHVGVEYEGKQLSEYEGIAATKKLLERCRARLSDSRKQPTAS